MKKLFVLLTVMVMVSVAGCGGKEAKEDQADGSKVTEEKKETQVEDSQELQEEIVISEEPEPIEESFITADIDLSFINEIFVDLGVISNDKTKLKSMQQVYDYIVSKGYSCYSYMESEITIDIEEAKGNGEFIIKPQFLMDKCEDTKNSGVNLILNDEGYLEWIQCNLGYYDMNEIIALKAAINEKLDSGYLDQYDTVIEYVGDKEEWEGVSITFKGTPINKTEAKKATGRNDVFAKLYFGLNEKNNFSSYMELRLY